MATTGRTTTSAPAASDVAASCREAGLVRLVGAARGDALAVVGLLAAALDDAGIPFHAGLRAATDGPREAADADVTIAVGVTDDRAAHVLAAGDLETAYAVADDLGGADPVLGLAGQLAAGTQPAGQLHEDATAAGVDRRPGVAVPTADPVEGLAFTTTVHGPFSGEPASAESVAEGLDEASDAFDRQLASAVALAVGADAPAGSRAGTAVERVLRPHVGGPYGTVGGFADVLDALARNAPGQGLALALGAGDTAAALEAWRDHGSDVHAAVTSAERRRHDGIETATVDAPDATVEPAARLLRDFRALEPAVLLRNDRVSALATAEGTDAAATLDGATGADTTVVGDARLAATAVADDDVEAAVRDVLGRDP